MLTAMFVFLPLLGVQEIIDFKMLQCSRIENSKCVDVHAVSFMSTDNAGPYRYLSFLDQQ